MVFEKNLTAMVKGIRANRGKESEYINTCLQEIQKEVTSKNMATKAQAVLKLAYLTMSGYDMQWAAFTVVEVMSNARFGTKRPGYLASQLCFNDSTDVGVLTINLFKKDFQAKSMYETGMALSALSSIASPDISKDIVTDLLAILSSSRAYLRKKTVLCLFKLFVKNPPALPTCFPKMKERLGDEDQGVLTATVNTFLELARKNARNYLSLVPQLYHILQNTSNNWLTIKLLKLFNLLCPLESRLSPKMIEPLTNLLQTSKAKSVEFEAIRCAVRIMPEGSSILPLAIEKLQTFLNSSDRNLRFLGLDCFKEILDMPHFKGGKLDVPDLQTKVLECIEESDTTARKVALHLLDSTVNPATFQDTVKKLLEFSRRSSLATHADDFINTILRMGAQDRYALVEDFAWYLLVLAEIARNVDTAHAGTVSEHFADIVVRVSQVRPYAVTLALSLLDRTPVASLQAADGETGGTASAASKDGTLDVATQVVGTCAWIIGEYHNDFGDAAEESCLKAARALLVPKHIQALPPSVQTQCVWAAAKIYLGASKCAPDAIPDLHALLAAQLPAFVVSTHVDVSERATMALRLVNHLKADVEAISRATVLFDDPLLPVRPEAQKAVPVPEDLDLDEPFFEPEPVPVEPARRADPSDPYQLAAVYKDDFGFMASQSAAPAADVASPSKDPSSSMFYLSSKDKDSAAGQHAAEGAAPGSTPAPADPLEQMREKLAAQRAAGGVKYEVMRDDVPGPGPVAAPAQAPAAAAPAAAPIGLPATPEKELTDLMGRLWTSIYKDEHVGLYACVRARNAKKQLVRVDLRVEKVASGTTVSDVSMKLPDGVVAQEAEGGAVALATGELQDKSSKVKINIGIGPFTAPVAYPLTCEVRYTVEGTEKACTTELRLPPTVCLAPAPMTEDDIAAYMAEHAAQFLGQQSAQVLSFAAPGLSAEALGGQLPSILGKCAGLCQLYGMQQGAGAGKSKSTKFLLIARPLSASGAGFSGVESLPQNARVVCLCACAPKEGGLDVKLTVKACRQDVADTIGTHVAGVLQELVEGRLKTAA